MDMHEYVSRNMQTYANICNYIQIYAQNMQNLCIEYAKTCTNMQMKYANICMKYASICKEIQGRYQLIFLATKIPLLATPDFYQIFLTEDGRFRKKIVSEDCIIDFHEKQV